jgi:hypothetical protein
MARHEAQVEGIAFVRRGCRKGNFQRETELVVSSRLNTVPLNEQHILERLLHTSLLLVGQGLVLGPSV